MFSGEAVVSPDSIVRNSNGPAFGGPIFCFLRMLFS